MMLPMNPIARRPASIDDFALTPKQALAVQFRAKFGTTKKAGSYFAPALGAGKRVTR